LRPERLSRPDFVAVFSRRACRHDPVAAGAADLRRDQPEDAIKQEGPGLPLTTLQAGVMNQNNDKHTGREHP
jgi:hypothetical protein